MRAKPRSSLFSRLFSGTGREVSPAPQRVVHFGRGLPIALTAALLIAGVAAIDIGPASAGPTASVAKKKKKCSKKKRRAHHCPGQASPVATLTALLAGSSIHYEPSVRANESQVIKFCRDGTFQRREELNGLDDGSGSVSHDHDYVLTAGGTWRITAAHVQMHSSSPSSLDGNLNRTTTSWQGVGPVQESPPQLPMSLDGSIKHPSGASSVTYVSQVWTLTPGGAGC
jgi:hypothetical protein